MSGPISKFIKHYYRHFNAATLVDAAEAYDAHLAKGGKMMVTLAGAMSTGELGVILAEMIRQDKVHAISCTAANLEEDIFNLVAHNHYVRVPNYRELSAADETALLERGLNRVTDTCIPEEEAMRRIEHLLLERWQRAEKKGERYFPFEYFYQLLREGALKDSYQIDPRDSWVAAACEKNLFIYSPGYEDSTLANMHVGQFKKGHIASLNLIKNGLEQMNHLIDWYRETSKTSSIGFFQVGGGIAGDFPICVVPLIRQDLADDSCPFWGYFCQISDSTTSYGSYSGAVPNEKITWEKLDESTPRFVIESDASIVAPLIFAHILKM